ncbi:MAG: UDP-N-acetylmuramoyl-tripeptide--D-alanyl-D-alanine ligase [Victivallales bacterium]|nr:UDP-N-acetylmuramoyl-tripeptide--D-alanyl-D-alanine ligase [Victivallales bacterium]
MSTIFNKQNIADISKGEYVLPPKAELSNPNLQDDTRKLRQGDIFVALPGELTDGYNYIGTAAEAGAALVISQRKPDDALVEKLSKLGTGYLLVEDAMTAFHQLANAHRQQFAGIKAVGITGSCGKTSTKEMCAAIMEAIYPNAVVKTEGNTNNFFGVPRNLLRLTQDTKAMVIETGSNHPGEIARLAAVVKPDIALITCIGAAHLEFFKDLNGVAEEKGDIYQALPQDGICIVPYQCPGYDILLKHANGRKIITFGLQEGADIRAIYGGIRKTQDGFGYALTLARKDTGEKAEVVWGIGGEEQACNAAAAAALGIANGLPLQEAAKVLANCKLPGARQAVSNINGVFWVNDAYNANPNSMSAGLKWFDEISKGSKRIVIIGDMREIGDAEVPLHEQALELAQSLFKNDRLITVGSSFAKCKANVENHATADEVHIAPEAGTWVYLKASNGVGLFKLVPKA